MPSRALGLRAARAFTRRDWESNWASRSTSQGRHNCIQKSESNIVNEASLYCHQVITDIRSRLALECEFPGRILAVRYEDVVANAEHGFRDIYAFIDEPIPSSTFNVTQRMANKVNKAAEKLEACRNSYDRTSVCGILSPTEHFINRNLV